MGRTPPEYREELPVTGTPKAGEHLGVFRAYVQKIFEENGESLAIIKLTAKDIARLAEKIETLSKNKAEFTPEECTVSFDAHDPGNIALGNVVEIEVRGSFNQKDGLVLDADIVITDRQF